MKLRLVDLKSGFVELSRMAQLFLARVFLKYFLDTLRKIFNTRSNLLSNRLDGRIFFIGFDAILNTNL